MLDEMVSGPDLRSQTMRESLSELIVQLSGEPEFSGKTGRSPLPWMEPRRPSRSRRPTVRSTLIHRKGYGIRWSRASTR